MAQEHDWNRPAPGELHLVQELVNTADLETGEDALADAAGLAAWVRERGLAAADDAFDADDLERVVEFREALRHVLLSHNGAAFDREAAAALDELAAGACVQVSFGEDGSPALVPAGRGASALLGRLFAAIAHAEADGTWARLKTCPADDCMWAFYDFSRNHSRTWCSMSVCGNRAKARTYRRRARSG
jgi:predicted RNA-binding Zn ribbon-like protein